MKISGTISEARFDEDGQLVLTVTESHTYTLDPGAYAPLAACYGHDPAAWRGRDVTLNIGGVNGSSPRGIGFLSPT